MNKVADEMYRMTLGYDNWLAAVLGAALGDGDSRVMQHGT